MGESARSRRELVTQEVVNNSGQGPWVLDDEEVAALKNVEFGTWNDPGQGLGVVQRGESVVATGGHQSRRADAMESIPGVVRGASEELCGLSALDLVTLVMRRASVHDIDEPLVVGVIAQPLGRKAHIEVVDGHTRSFFGR